MKIAVTGGMGFIGHEVVRKMLDLGHEVVVVDYWKTLLKRYEAARLPIMSDFYRDLPECVAVVEPWEFIHSLKEHAPHVVVHAGAVVDTKDLGSDDLFEKNITYTQNLTDGCSTLGSHIIFFSSAAVYGASGKPNNPYGLTKAMGEQIVKKSKTRTASIRLFNVFGRNEHHKGTMASVPFQIARSIGAGSTFHLHSLTSMRDFVPSQTVVNVVAGLVDKMIGTGNTTHETYDVGTGQATLFADMAKMVTDTLGRPFEMMIKQVSRPAELEGRYQDYTCAGTYGVENLGGAMTTEQGIKGAYGVDE